MNFFDHKNLGNHLLRLCPKVVKHPVYIYISLGATGLVRYFDYPFKPLILGAVSNVDVSLLQYNIKKNLEY